jgi:photosystem II stability/assembly factor-like uncharacterized protein
VAVDAGGNIIRTTDGETWSGINNTAISNASHIAVLTNSISSKGKAITASGSTIVATTLNDIYYSSNQGLTWNHAKSPGQINDMIFFNNTFVIVGGGEGFIEYSEDGISWTTVLSGGSRFQSVAYGPNKIIACGMGYRIVVSDDNGKTWKNDNGGDGTQRRFNSVVFGVNKYVGVGTALNGFSSMWATSTDGETWDNETVDSNYHSMWDVAFGNGRYVTGGYHYLLRSSDGITWEDEFIHDGEVRNINYHNGRFIATGHNTFTGAAMVFISDDCGESWTEFVFGSSVDGAMVDAEIELFQSEQLFSTSISGSVKDESEQPIVDSLILFTDIDTGEIECALSDTNGEFSLFVEHNGDFEIACIATGFLTEEILVESESTTENLQFVLEMAL